MAINKERREEFGLAPQPKDSKDVRGVGGKEGNTASRKTDGSNNGRKGWELGGDDKGTLSGPGSGRASDASKKGTKGWKL